MLKAWNSNVPEDLARCKRGLRPKPPVSDWSDVELVGPVWDGHCNGGRSC